MKPDFEIVGRPASDVDVSIGAYVGLFLRRNPPHKDGSPGSYYLCVRVAPSVREVGRRKSFGLHTCNYKQACERALCVVSALQEAAGLYICNRQLAMLCNTQLPLWAAVDGLKLPSKVNYSSRGLHAAPEVAKRRRKR